MNESPKFEPMRRQDRAVTDEDWIEEMLRTAPYGVLGLSRGGQPFVNMNIFVYVPAEKCLYLHTARQGHTRTSVEENDRVCFSISEMGRLLPATHALEFSVEYAGVVVFGTARVVDDDEAARALQLLLDKYAPHLRPGQHYRPSTPEEIARTTVYRIQIERWSGKKKVAPADHPGAFRYGEVAVPPWDDWQHVEAKS